MTEKYIIKDWAGNICFNGQEFSDFDDAWDFIRSEVKDESEHGEYYVEEKRRNKS